MDRKLDLTEIIEAEKRKTEMIISGAIQDLIAEIGHCDVSISVTNTFSLSTNNIKHLVNTEVNVDIRI